jgi:hypothetical protein
MSREYVVFGEFIVKVSGGLVGTVEELGLTSEQVRIHPRYNFRDIPTDDFGAAPVETRWDLADATVTMTLVHYDPDVLNKCMGSAMGGGGFDTSSITDNIDGFMAGAGRLLGFNRGLGTAANMYVTVYLIPADDGGFEPYRFYACYLDARPLVIPLGTERTLVQLSWRVIPYQEITTEGGVMVETSSQEGVTLWDHSDELLI